MEEEASYSPIDTLKGMVAEAERSGLKSANVELYIIKDVIKLLELQKSRAAEAEAERDQLKFEAEESAKWNENFNNQIKGMLR